MASTKLEELESLFDDHPSLDASLQDFEQASRSSGSPSRAAFRSDTESERPSASTGRYSPPAWRRDGNGNRSSGFWRHGSRDIWGPADDLRESSPEFESADEGDREEMALAAAARTRLPTGSLSPEKQGSPAPELLLAGAGDLGKPLDVKEVAAPSSPSNFIRFAIRAEVQHRTEPFEAVYYFFKNRFGRMTRSWTSLLFSTVVALLSIVSLRVLFQPGAPQPVPDLVKVAGLARAFEPLIYYSENGVKQIGDLQATGVAVWDLGESVRSANMTSGPIIVKELDDLSESLKTLAVELTRFFANVDGDVDGILIVMDWAGRELSQLVAPSPSALTSAFDNVHSLLSRCGVLEASAGTPTQLGHLATSLFGLSSPQRTRQILQRTFTEFLSVLEEAIESELQHSLAIFALFESIDRQFLNLARTVVRESSAQDAAQDDLLSSLWTRLLGPTAGSLNKFERNRALLANIRAGTVQNKRVLLDHNGKLLALKANLESVRRKLVSPLLRANASTLRLEDQIRGLEEVAGHLGGVRERQRGKLMERLYGAGSDGVRRVEGRWD